MRGRGLVQAHGPAAACAIPEPEIVTGERLQALAEVTLLPKIVAAMGEPFADGLVVVDDEDRRHDYADSLSTSLNVVPRPGAEVTSMRAP